MAIGIYRLTGSSSETIVLNVPRFSGDTRKPGNYSSYSIAQATLEWGEQFDHTATFFVRSSTVRDRMVAQGFTSVILLSEHTGERWTFENGTTIDFASNGFWVTLPNSTTLNLMTNGSDFVATTYPSDHLNNWLTDPLSYVGQLTSVGELTFSCNRYYPVNTLNETNFNSAWTGNTPFDPPTDPYAEGGESDTGGGTGNFDGTSVDVDFASLPTLSAVDTGFLTLYNPSLSQLQSLANYMWSGLFDLDTFKKLFADPMQAILGLSIVPGPVPNGGTQNVKIGNIDSGISMTKAASQYIDIDCGTLNVEEFWGAYLDYEPYTKAEIFLPFIGVHQIAIDDIMNKAVHIKYHIDLLSGGCACEIKCGGSVLYTFIGSCAVSIPITGSDWTNVINGVISIASSIGTMVATGGASAPSSVASIASAAVNSLKPSIEKSGSVSGAGGLLAGKTPVLILTRPRQAVPGKQNAFTGYPAFITRSLGALSGYTEVHSIRLSGIDGTESEIDEIEELLKGGVIL